MPENNNNPYKKYFDVLELKPEADFSDVKNTYMHLRKLYSSQPLVLSPIIDEMTEGKRIEILNQVEDAYVNLKRHFSTDELDKISTTRQRVQARNVPEFEVFNGNALKLTREVLGIDLKEIAMYSGVPLKHLQNIEQEKFDQLPPKGYVKVFLKQYAEYLSLDVRQVTEDYMKHYDQKK
ncbi:MAG: helix-turn-helix domain-containing protein [bacterium]|nr:helix-turn-helix domain-containing protein [bacterium]